MESLLRWSIENSTTQDGSSTASPAADAAAERIKSLDPGIIDHILGKTPAEEMKEDMAVALDVSRNESERVDALDHLELLIEHIDNANNLEKLGLWEPLHILITAEKSTPDIQVHALWVIGTAVQHNPEAQDVYLALNPFSTLVSLLDPSSSPSNSVRSKVLYVLSGLLRHNAHAVKLFGSPEVNGWPTLRNSLQDPDISVRRKAVFIMGTLLRSSRISNQASSLNDTNITSPDAPTGSGGPIHPNSHAANLKDPLRIATSEPTLNAMREHHIAENVVDSIVNPLPYGEDGNNLYADLDYETKAMSLVYTYVVTCSAELSKERKIRLLDYLREGERHHDMAYLLDKLGLSPQEYKALVQCINQ